LRRLCAIAGASGAAQYRLKAAKHASSPVVLLALDPDGQRLDIFRGR
jgi:hypothetical protein